MTTNPLTKAAKQALAAQADSDVEFAFMFLQSAGVDPKLLGNTINDRLIKSARMVKSTIQHINPDMDDGITIETTLQRLVKDFELVASGKLGHVPKVSFGNTGLQMPIATLGCMRFQEAWGDRVSNMNQVGGDCQENLVQILKTAILDYGMTHIETARGYGCSELQIGVALKQLFLTGLVKRSDLIIQSKVNASKDVDVFRKNLEKSFALLQVDYLDLFSIHGLNLPTQMEWVFGDVNGDGINCMTVVREYMDAGKIRHLGFSTHGPTDLIMEAINKGVFEYVNLHYHYIGSYTASGYGNTTRGGNFDAVKLLQEKNMGIFIISPYDKGGALYAPSRGLRRLCLPEAEPMIFQSWWLWNHHKIDPAVGGGVQLHTFTVGAARPSDLDDPALAAYYHREEQEKVVAKVSAISKRLEAAYVTALGQNWVDSWWKGLPKALHSKYNIEHNQMVWLYNSIKAYGMYKFATNRYGSFEGNAKTWDYSKSTEENLEKRGLIGWGYVPGLPLDPKQDYTADDLKDVPAENISRVQEAESFCYEWLATKKPNPDETTNEGAEKEAKAQKMEIPEDWETAYDQRTWPDFPDRQARDAQSLGVL